MELLEKERIDDLQFKNLKVIQKVDGFCFGIDAVLLSDFARRMKPAELVVDLCTGTGVVAILLAGKTNAKRIVGVEIQKSYAEMATRSIALNQLSDRVSILHEDLNKLSKSIGAGTVDSITVNPPYKKKDSGIQNEENELTIARHEVCCTLEDVIRESARMLKTNGALYMVHRPERLVDIMCLMRKHHIEPKRMRMVHPTASKAPNIILIEGRRDGGSFLKWEPPLYVYDEAGNYTDDILKIYQLKDEK